MARKRMTDPTVWIDSAFHRLSCAQQVLFFAHISLADDEGRGVADPDDFKMACFPTKPEITEDDVEEMMDVLSQPKRRKSLIPLIQYYMDAVGGKFYFIPQWFRHQKVSHPTPSKLPAPPALKRKSFVKHQRPAPGGMESVGEIMKGGMADESTGVDPDLQNAGDDVGGSGKRNRDNGGPPFTD